MYEMQSQYTILPEVRMNQIYWFLFFYQIEYGKLNINKKDEAR